MSAQVSLETRLHNFCTTFDGAWHAMAVIHAGSLGLTNSIHGHPNRWDWGVTQRSLFDAQARCAKAREVFEAMSPTYQAHVMVDPSPEAVRFRAAMKGGAR